MSRRRVREPPPLPPGWRGGWALFFDVDGTLLAFADRPDRVRAPAPLIRRLRRLRRAAGGAFALLSGRPLADLNRIFPGFRPCAAGLHGLERRGGGGGATRRRADDRRLQRARDALRRLVARHPALRLEDKGASLALHYRRDPRLAARAGAAMARAAARAGRGYRVQPGARVLELLPAGSGKGSALAAFLRVDPFRGRRPLFAGDDRSDEAAFERVNRGGGISIKIGAGPTRARHRLAGPRALAAWLTRLLATGRPKGRRSRAGHSTRR